MKKKIAKKNVFVIDDDKSIGDILQFILEGENYRVYAFTTGKSALQFLTHQKPDVVMLDYFLMGENFFTILERFQKAGEIPIILMSANKAAQAFAVKHKIREFVEKPFQRKTLLQVIARNVN